ncbi:hypothetical protein [Paenibacillus apiarius]|uniref:hypothetical protein n=1 Tax=Paenibacillus apiarius TaxID=46240 RepID=UPI00197F06DC|nr:hypothetical protein [Paenibacillus apiarius]MBN3524859.1 hypothetical protein [Paenibacillus apiarius]
MKQSLTALLLLSLALPGTALANPAETQVAKDLTVNYTPVIRYEKGLPESTDEIPINSFASAANSQFQNLAVGKSTAENGVGAVLGTGTTKGRVITTVTSATASLWYIMVFQQPELVDTGSKGWSLAYGTAFSHVSKFQASPGRYETISYHTATHDGVLFEEKTLASVQYSGGPY